MIVEYEVQEEVRRFRSSSGCTPENWTFLSRAQATGLIAFDHCQALLCVCATARAILISCSSFTAVGGISCWCKAENVASRTDLSIQSMQCLLMQGPGLLPWIPCRSHCFPSVLTGTLMVLRQRIYHSSSIGTQRGRLESLSRSQAVMYLPSK